MFTLAQYVLGIGKSETQLSNDESNCASTDTAYYENDDPNQCVQTNIENDWILIEIEQKNSNAAKAATSKAPSGSRKPRIKARAKALEKVQSQEESWFVEPPECFKNCSLDSRDVKTSSLENLLIEHPTMSVFDNLFTKRVAPVKAEPPKKPSQKLVVYKKNDKENALPARSCKKKQVEVASVNLLSASNQSKGKCASEVSPSDAGYGKRGKVHMHRHRTLANVTGNLGHWRKSARIVAPKVTCPCQVFRRGRTWQESASIFTIKWHC